MIGARINDFTFQSGTIQAGIEGLKEYLTSNFTFQSGTIQAKIKYFFLINKTSLHSNLVQFKRPGRYMLPGMRPPLHSNLVQFKRKQTHFMQVVILLYIPIWYNSSEAERHRTLFEYNFTFQSGTIQARRTAESCFQCFQLQFLSTMII